jgi:O-antigen biosynthesis protein WbqP
VKKNSKTVSQRTIEYRIPTDLFKNRFQGEEHHIAGYQGMLIKRSDQAVKSGRDRLRSEKSVERKRISIKRVFDLVLSFCAGAAVSLPLMLIAVLVKISSKGPVLYWSDRVGADNKLFKMPKFRTMKPGTPEVATHLMIHPDSYLTSIGKVLRTLSLDELPQLWSVLKGDMSFVGPRPALYNQFDLIELRTIKGIHRLVPGITGWAQINGRDDLTIPEKVALDEYYMKHKSFLFDLKILSLTVFKVIKRDGVRH